MPGNKLKIMANIIRKEQVGSQQELKLEMANQGFAITQSSISRSLRKLGVVKRNGFYSLPEIHPSDNGKVSRLAIQIAGPNLIVIKSLPGSASRMALLIDQANISEVIGTIAGDDTIFVAVLGENGQRRACRAILNIFE